MTGYDVAVSIRDAVLANLLGRKGFDWVWDDIDPDIQEEIRAELLALILSRMDQVRP